VIEPGGDNYNYGSSGNGATGGAGQVVVYVK
jgi:hypothetical protein